jgi:hypothetical protein
MRAARQVYRVFDEEEFLAGRDLGIAGEAQPTDAEPAVPVPAPGSVPGRPSRLAARTAPLVLLAAGAGVAAVVVLVPGRPVARSSDATESVHEPSPQRMWHARAVARPRGAMSPAPRRSARHRTTVRLAEAHLGPRPSRLALSRAPSADAAPTPVPTQSQEFGFER